VNTEYGGALTQMEVELEDRLLVAVENGSPADRVALHEPCELLGEAAQVQKHCMSVLWAIRSSYGLAAPRVVQHRSDTARLRCNCVRVPSAHGGVSREPLGRLVQQNQLLRQTHAQKP
jgi:hypothetical protein